MMRVISSLFWGGLLLGALLIGANACRSSLNDKTSVTENGTHIAKEWNLLMLEIIQQTDGYCVPVSSRCMGYIGIAAYEATAPFSHDYASYMRKVKKLPAPVPEPEKEYEPVISLNAAYAKIIPMMFPNLSDKYLDKISELEERIELDLGHRYHPDVFNRSKGFGVASAEFVGKWAMEDTIGAQGWLNNYISYNPETYTIENSYRPAEQFHYAMTPQWGKVRLLALDSLILLHPPCEFSETKNSDYYKEARLVYDKSQKLTDEQKWIATFWSDDYTKLTLNTCGRWISIASQVLESKNTDIYTAVKTYMLIGIALNDAAVTTWYNKYTYNFERPDTYIKRNIDKNWKPMAKTPNFPSFPSGHSTFSAACINVFHDIFHSDISLTDKTHEYRKEFYGAPRYYNNDSIMLDEIAWSRIYLGVHYKMDTDGGNSLGKQIARKVMSLDLSPENP